MAREQRPSYSGNINYANESGINGWLCDRNQEADKIRFFLFINGLKVGTFAAARIRIKTNAKGVVSRRLGFHIILAADWTVTDRSIVVVQPCASTDFHLSALFESMKVTTPQSVPAPERNLKELISEAVDLSSVVHQTMQKHILPTLKHHTGNKDWPTIADLNRSLLLQVPDLDKSLLLLGRGSLYAKEFEDAQRTLSIACLLYPHLVDAHYYCGISYLRSGDYVSAVTCLRRSLDLDSGSPRNKRDLSDALARSARSLPRNEHRAAIEAEALSLLLEVSATQPSLEITLRAARLAFEQSRFAEALELFQTVADEQPSHVPALTGISRCLVGLRRISEALRMAKRISEIDPNNETARYQLRVLRFLNDDEGPHQENRFGALVFSADGTIRFDGSTGTDQVIEAKTSAAEAALRLSRAEAQWLEVGAEGARAGEPFTPSQHLDARFGCHRFREGESGRERVFWHRDALTELVRSTGTVPSLPRLTGLESLYLPGFQAPKPKDRVIVMSRHGIVKFGGGEHFIESMADHYRSIGLDPLIVGVSNARAGETGEIGGRRFSFVGENPSSLRGLVLETGATLVHGISGTGMLAASALEMMNVQFIYGVHFWREALGSDAGDAFFDEARAPIPRSEFEFVLTRASTVYANSHYTRQVLETAFGVRCPVVYSVPHDLELAA
jgi:tetratricopeptide (TPR) repeat protein